MPKFRKKTEIVEAVLWTGENISEVCRFLGVKSIMYTATTRQLEGTPRTPQASPGDYIVKGSAGGFYRRAPEDFTNSYAQEPDLPKPPEPDQPTCDNCWFCVDPRSVILDTNEGSPGACFNGNRGDFTLSRSNGCVHHWMRYPRS